MSRGIGYMPMPEDFKYAELVKIGRPKHERFDDFWCRHPTMDCGKRAKIFAPFAALKGYDQEIEKSAIAAQKRIENRVEHIPVYDDLY